MKLYILVIATVLLVSCGNKTNSTTSTDTDTVSTTEKVLEVAGKISTKELDSMCYLLVEGSTNQDTKLLRVVIKGNDVTGILMYLPHQKDGRFGRFKGTKKGDIIDAKWNYEQEGMKESVPVSFKITDTSILQKPSSFDMGNGREYLDEQTRYNWQYLPADCNKLQQYRIDF